MPDTLIPELLAALPIPALVVGPSERITASNAEARTLLGQQIDGRHYATILRQPSVADAIAASLSDQRPRTARHLGNDGAQDTLFEVTCRHISVTGDLVVSFVDITHLEQAGQMRRDFVANVSHELRTPLTALIGFIETLQGAARHDEAARDRFLVIMSDEATRMNRLVGDLLSLSRVESQERVRPVARVDLSAELFSTLKSLTPLAESANVKLTLSGPDQPVILHGDADQLRQVVTNLVENAIKYGGSGGQVEVVLTTALRDPAVRGPAVRIQVIDKGPGIDPVHLPRLTERFYRADSHRSRELGGTGLGLAIVKHIVNRHRGRLRVESELGQGSVFTVILPL
jgi:two-component system phosphate regulon sensor histidine kinase PhoR